MRGGKQFASSHLAHFKFRLIIFCFQECGARIPQNLTTSPLFQLATLFFPSFPSFSCSRFLFFHVHVSHHQTGIGAADDGWKGGLKSSLRRREKKEKEDKGVGASRCQKISVGCSTNFCAVLGFPPARRLFLLLYKFFRDFRRCVRRLPVSVSGAPMVSQGKGRTTGEEKIPWAFLLKIRSRKCL